MVRFQRMIAFCGRDNLRAFHLHVHFIEKILESDWFGQLSLKRLCNVLSPPSQDHASASSIPRFNHFRWNRVLHRELQVTVPIPDDASLRTFSLIESP